MPCRLLHTIPNNYVCITTVQTETSTTTLLAIHDKGAMYPARVHQPAADCVPAGTEPWVSGEPAGVGGPDGVKGTGTSGTGLPCASLTVMDAPSVMVPVRGPCTPAGPSASGVLEGRAQTPSTLTFFGSQIICKSCLTPPLATSGSSTN